MRKVFVLKSSLLIGILLMSALIVACGSSNEHQNNKHRNGSKPHHTKDGFRNLYVEDTEKNFFDFLKMRLLGDVDWADHETLATEVPIVSVNIDTISTPQPTPQITWLGHSMFLIQLEGINILTDPVFSDRASPLSFAGPKRYVKHAMNYKDLPHIDRIIISHNHYDHLDEPTIIAIINNQKIPPTFFVPLGLKKWLLDTNIPSASIVEMDWWQSHQQSGLTIKALPSQHWSARSLSDRLKTLWASWSIQSDDFTLWFGGDTGYNKVQFKEIGRHLGKVDVALIPIGAYEPRWFMQNYHVNPNESVKIHQDINATFSIGMHWGTFPLTAEAPMQPVSDLAIALELAKISTEDFITMSIGETKPILGNLNKNQ